MSVGSSCCSGFEGLKSFEHRLNVPENTSVSVGSLNESLNALPDTLHFPKSRVFKRGNTLIRHDISAPKPRRELAADQIQWILEPPERGAAVLKVLIGVGLGFFLFTNPDARQITADLLRSTANALAPEKDGKTFQDRVKDAVVEKVTEDQ